MQTSRPIEVQGRFLGVAVAHETAWRFVATHPSMEDIDGATFPSPAEARARRRLGARPQHPRPGRSASAVNAFAGPLAALPGLLPGIAATAARHDRDGSFPHGNLAALRGAGLLALTVPAALGGGGAGLRVAAAAVEQVGAACPATALVLAMQYLKHAALARSPAWPAALREMVQRDAVDEGALINVLRVEPELGSPTRGGLPATVARRTADGWALSGRKRYSTGLPALRWLEVWARTDEETPRVGSFLVPTDAPRDRGRGDLGPPRPPRTVGQPRRSVPRGAGGSRSTTRSAWPRRARPPAPTPRRIGLERFFACCRPSTPASRAPRGTGRSASSGATRAHRPRRALGRAAAGAGGDRRGLGG